MYIYIKNISWVDKEAGEASVEITDGKYSLWCFSYPFKKKIGDVFIDYIYCLDALNIIKTIDKTCQIIKKSTEWNYSLRGCVIDRTNKIVKVGNFMFDLSEQTFPNDLYIEDFIEFTAIRLSLY